MGQAMNKLKTIGDVKPREKTQKELQEIIAKYINTKYRDWDEIASNWTPNQFYHEVYMTLEGISEESGAMQFKLPSFEKIKNLYKNKHGLDSKKALSKKEFQDIIQEVLTFDSFFIGQGAKDTVLYIFGAPIVTLFAKRILPGPFSSLPDDVFLPAMTSLTVYYLAKMNRL